MENKANKIKKLLNKIEGLMKGMNIPDDVIEKKITIFGNSAHVLIPRKYINKKAIIIIKKSKGGKKK